MDLLVGMYNVKLDVNCNNGGLKFLLRKRQVEVIYVVNSLILVRVQGMMDCWINFENELWRMRVVEQ